MKNHMLTNIHPKAKIGKNVIIEPFAITTGSSLLLLLSFWVELQVTKKTIREIEKRKYLIFIK